MSVLETPVTTLYPARAGARPLTAEDLWALPRVGAPVPAPDGTWCVVPVTTYDLERNVGTTRIWRIAPNMPPTPLTSPEQSSSDPALSPDGRRLAFCRKGPNGKAQLHVMSLDGGEAVKLTDLPLAVFDPKWLPDGSGIVFASYLIKSHFTPEATKAEIERRDKDPVKAHVTEDRFYRHWDTWLTTGEVPHLFVIDLATNALRDLTPESTVWFDWMEPGGVYDIAPDGKEIAFSGISWAEQIPTAKSSLYVVPVAGGAVRCLTADHPSDDARPRYSPDGKSIVYGMQHDPFFYADRVRLMRYDRATSKHTEMTSGWDRSPAHWTFGRDETLFLETEDAGRVSLFALTSSGEPKTIVRGGWVTGARVAGGKVFFAMQSLSQPSEVYTCAADGANLTRWTTFTDEVLSRCAMGEVREMTFAGAGNETVQMFVVFPPGYREGQPLPMVQVVHGGPHATSGDVFHMRWNPHLFAAPGYVAVMVNFQGSTSWGQDFAQRIQGEWAERPFQDIMRSTDVLVAAGIADGKRLAAAGGSYGGYLVSWIAGHTDRFRCIVNHAGVYDALGQYASDWTMGRGRAWGGEAWEGIENIDRCNPARYSSGMNTPMLVTHGERDYRVPINHGLQCYGMLKAKGVPARLVYFPDENHWVLKPRNSIVWYREVHAWLARFLT
jgi:dipeptidyl aminopeptidase/acylaminoacyl peptidase